MTKKLAVLFLGCVLIIGCLFITGCKEHEPVDESADKPGSEDSVTTGTTYPRAEYVDQNKDAILERLEKFKALDLEEPAVIVNGKPISLKIAALEVEFGIAEYIGTANAVLEDGRPFPNIRSKDQAHDILSKDIDDLRAKVTSEVFDRMIRSELYRQEAERRGFEVTEEYAREYAEKSSIKNAKEYIKEQGLQPHESEKLIIEIVLEILDMTEEEHLEWSVDMHRREMAVGEMRNSMTDREEYEKLGEKLMDEADIEYVSLP